MVKGMLLLCALSIGAIVYSQEEIYLNKGVLSASITIAPSTMLNRDEGNIYINGYAEYFLDRDISLRSDSYILVDGRNEIPFLQKAFRSYFGLAYHFGDGNWDNHIGFQSGITIMQLTSSELVAHNPTDVSASVAFRAGTTYYVWKYFNFFANVTYVRSKLSGSVGSPYPTDELIFSAGLGFQIPTKK